MLTKGYPLELQGRLAEAAEICEAAVEAARLSANRHYLFWALFELGLAALLRRRPRRRDRRLRGEPALRRPPDRRDDSLGRRRPGLGPRRSRSSTAGETERGLEAMRALGSDEIEFAVPVERCFDWETLRARRARRRQRRGGGGATPTRAEELAAGLDLHLPGRRLRRGPGRRSCSHRAKRRRRSSRRGRRSTGAPRPGPTCRRRSRAAARPTRSPRRASATEAIARAARGRAASSTRCGSLRERDAVAARAAQARRPARGARARRRARAGSTR